jgi:hypothetical protein
MWSKLKNKLFQSNLVISNQLQNTQIMKKLLMILFCCMAFICQAQTKRAMEIIQEINKITTSTNFNDPVASKAAQAKLKKLGEELKKETKNMDPDKIDPSQFIPDMNNNNNNNQQDSTNPSGFPSYNNPSNTQNLPEGLELKVTAGEYQAEIMKTVMAAGGNKYPDIFLGRMMEEKIIQEYEEERSQKPSNAMVYEITKTLLIDMSKSGADQLIDALDNYSGLEELMITGGEQHKTPNFSIVYQKISKIKTLNKLALINFKDGMKNLPPQFCNLRDLKALALFNNNISNLPENLANLSVLSELYIDLNPITKLPNSIGALSKLEIIGIASTQIPEAEQKRIQQILPKCKILSK